MPSIKSIKFAYPYYSPPPPPAVPCNTPHPPPPPPPVPCDTPPVSPPPPPQPCQDKEHCGYHHHPPAHGPSMPPALPPKTPLIVPVSPPKTSPESPNYPPYYPYTPSKPGAPPIAPSPFNFPTPPNSLTPFSPPSNTLVSLSPGGGGKDHTAVIAVCTSLGGLFFLAFLAAGLFCAAKKKKRPIMAPAAGAAVPYEPEQTPARATYGRGEISEGGEAMRRQLDIPPLHTDTVDEF